jgi:hypothetical protein
MSFAAFVDWLLQWGMALASMLAAFCWVRSTREIPNVTAGLNWDGGRAFPVALAEQSLWNARAAKFAAVAAAFQGIVFIKSSMPWLPFGS